MLLVSEQHCQGREAQTELRCSSVFYRFSVSAEGSESTFIKATEENKPSSGWPRHCEPVRGSLL